MKTYHVAFKTFDGKLQAWDVKAKHIVDAITRTRRVFTACVFRAEVV